MDAQCIMGSLERKLAYGRDFFAASLQFVDSVLGG